MEDQKPKAQDTTEPAEVEPNPEVQPLEPDIVTEGCDEPITKRETDQIERAEKLEEQVKKFEEVSGIEITRYNGRSIGEAVKFIQDAERIGNTIGRLKSTVEEHQRVVDAARSAITNLQKLQKS